MTVLSILNKINKKDKLNILTCPTHERYESNLCQTGHNFYSITQPGIKDWTVTYAGKPDNYTIIDLTKQLLPSYIKFDLVLSQNKFGQYGLLAPLAHKMGIPLISLEHTLPPDSWSQQELQRCKDMKGDVNVFISRYSEEKWGFDNEVVIHHGIDTELFSPDLGNAERDKTILSVVNDWVNRDWCCGFKLWQQTVQGLPVLPVGDTEGLSKPSKDVYELVEYYKNNRIFYNTSLISPIPTSLLEAMSCGCACVTTENCMIPEFIQHEQNGLMSSDPKKLREYLEFLLDDKNKNKATKMGKEARKTIKNRFSLSSFINNWNKLFNEVAN